jgi:hypothetical protein
VIPVNEKESNNRDLTSDYTKLPADNVPRVFKKKRKEDLIFGDMNILKRKVEHSKQPTGNN